MNKNLLIIFLILGLISCGRKKDCSKLKTGVFTTQTRSSGVITITRTESQSIEDIPVKGERMINSIQWTGDCTFTIKYESGDKPSAKTADLPIDCEIIEIGENYHIVRARIRGTDIQGDYRMENKIN